MDNAQSGVNKKWFASKNGNDGGAQNPILYCPMDAVWLSAVWSDIKKFKARRI
jgi:hypothetical protein